MEIYNDIESIRKRIYRAFTRFLEELEGEVDWEYTPRLEYGGADELYDRELRGLDDIYLELDVKKGSYRLFTYNDDDDTTCDIEFREHERLKITSLIDAIISRIDSRDYHYDSYIDKSWKWCRGDNDDPFECPIP